MQEKETAWDLENLGLHHHAVAACCSMMVAAAVLSVKCTAVITATSRLLIVLPSCVKLALLMSMRAAGTIGSLSHSCSALCGSISQLHKHAPGYYFGRVVSCMLQHVTAWI